MYRVILVDDEPLILAGIASLLTWEDHGCTIVGKATNGPSAFDMIIELKPDIVITDIRMPVLNGLELIEACQKNGCTFSFLVLTNLEEFQLARKALALGASDYLVKLDLNQEELVKALERSKEACNLLVNQHDHLSFIQNNSEDLIRSYFIKVFISGDAAAALPQQLDQAYKKPFLILFSLRHDSIHFQPQEEGVDLKQANHQIQDILGGISSRFFQASALLNYNSNTMLLVASLNAPDPYKETITAFCKKVNTALKTYFELTAVFGVSTVAQDVSHIAPLLQESKTALEYYYYDSSAPVVFYFGQEYHKSLAKTFNINFLKKDISTAVQQNDSAHLADIFGQIIGLFTECTPNKDHATSACINIYTYLHSFFDHEGSNYQDIFPYTINIAEYLNHFTSLSDILEWLQSFRDKLCKLLDDRKENRSDKLVEQAKRYINEHYTEKLALTEIAEVLNISAGHLSITFKKFTGTTLSDYIAYVKIEHAKELIDTHRYLMYEISDLLGFDNPYYFSKVFKKVTGISPRDHEKRI